MSQWALPCKDSLHRLADAHTCPSFTWPACAPPHGSPTSDAESSTSACSLIDFDAPMIGTIATPFVLVLGGGVNVVIPKSFKPHSTKGGRYRVSARSNPWSLRA